MLALFMNVRFQSRCTKIVRIMRQFCGIMKLHRREKVRLSSTVVSQVSGRICRAADPKGVEFELLKREVVEISSSRSSAIGAGTKELYKERGVAITEFLITFPFLLIMLAGVVDLGIALNRYYTINRIAYEATRFAASIPGLEPGTYGTNAAAVGQSFTSPTAPGHLQLRARVDLLLTRNGINPAQLPADYLSTERAAPAGATRDQVSVRISIPFAALFPVVGDVLPNLRTRVSGPYLFPS